MCGSAVAAFPGGWVRLPGGYSLGACLFHCADAGMRSKTLTAAPRVSRLKQVPSMSVPFFPFSICAILWPKGGGRCLFGESGELGFAKINILLILFYPKLRFFPFPFFFVSFSFPFFLAGFFQSCRSLSRP